MTYLDELLGKIKYKEIKKVIKSRENYIVELHNGKRYQVVSASQSSRGFRCSKAYVSKDVDKEILDCVIRPTLCVLELPENEQIVYF